MVIRKLQQLAADVLFPEYNACHLCGRFSEQEDIVCARCAAALKALRYQHLHIASAEPHAPLEVCLAAYPHRDEARELVHLFKYRSDSAVAGLLAEGMAAALALSPRSPSRIDAVIPVPLHVSRLEQRGYNQALLLAKAVCRHAGLELLEGSLIRLYATGTQLHRNYEQRMEAMRHAFAVNDPKAVRGLHLLLVDDVLTTGATSISCANTLLAAGAQSVSLLTACRT